MPPVRTATRISQTQFSDFSGGLNLRSSELELQPNESPDCMNVTLDERGGIVKRLGLSRVGNALGGTATNIFYSGALDDFFVQVGAALKKTDTFTTVTTVATFTTSARCAMCEFNSQLVVVHPVDGVFTYNGTTWTNRSTTVKGNAIAAWQNKIWVGGDSSNRPRVWWSNAGDATTWTTASDYIDVREVDDQIITALGIGQDMDVVGRPGLLVAKEHSCYRINNSTTGSYTTLATESGAASHLGLASLGGITVMVNHHGIWAVAGTSPPVLASERLGPLFSGTQLQLTAFNLANAGVRENRFVFSLPRFGSNTPNLTLEYHPRDGWMVPHSFGLNAYTAYTKGDDLLYGVGTLNGADYYAFKVFNGGADDGEAIDARFQTRWYEFAGENKVRVRRVMLSGRGAFDMYVRTDFETGAGTLFPVGSEVTGEVWNGFDWGEADWGATLFEEYFPIYSLGFGKAFSFRFQHSGSVSKNAPPLLGDGQAQEVGAFAVYSALVDFVPLGSN